MIEILLAAICFDALMTDNHTGTYVGVVHSDVHDICSAASTDKVLSKAVGYVGFGNLGEYYCSYPSLIEDLEREASIKQHNKKRGLKYYHPVIASYYTDPEPDTQELTTHLNAIKTSLDKAHIEIFDSVDYQFSKFLSLITTAASNESLYIVPTLDEIRLYPFICNNASKDDLWFLEGWDGK